MKARLALSATAVALALAMPLALMARADGDAIQADPATDHGLDVGGQPYWVVNEGEYCMMNTLDLSVERWRSIHWIAQGRLCLLSE